MVRQIRVPLELDKIRNGAFLKRVDEQLATGVQELISFVRNNPAQAKGAKTKVTVEVTVMCDGGEPTLERFSVKAKSKVVTPDDPAAVSKADMEESQTGELELRIPYTEGYVEPQQGYLPMKGEEAA